MAMMVKMRNLAPAFIVSVGVLFVLFMVMSDSSVQQLFGARSNVVGSINGVKISYREFMKTLDTERQNQKQQTGKDIPDSQTDKFRDQVWNALVTKTLIDQQVKKFNIHVTDEEIRDAILSENPPQFLKRYFIDSTGKFNRRLYLSVIYNPKYSSFLLQAEDYIRQSKLNQKLQSMLLASVTVSPEQVKRDFIEKNTKINAQYALVGLNEFPAKSLKVSDETLKDYYNQHLNEYQIKAQRKLKYVLFSTAPSKDDSANVKREAEDLLTQIKNNKSDTTTFKYFVDTYSNKPYSKDTVAVNRLHPETVNLFEKSKAGSIIGPVLTPDGYIIYHFVAKVPGKVTYVRASHILINQYGSDKANENFAMKIYEQIKKGGNFAELAKKFSKDPGSAKRGGDLGWFGKGQMVPAFEKACFSGRVGVVQRPIKTRFGYHIIKVTGRTSERFVVEKLVEPIQTSATTRDQQLSNAKDFNYITNKDGFEKEAKLMNYKVKETSNFSKGYNYVPGIGVNKDLVDFAFNNDLNTISDPIRTQSGYVVAMVSGVTPERIRPFEKVKNEIKPRVIKKLQYQKAGEKAELIKSKINGDLSKAGSFDSSIVVNQTGQFTVDKSIPTVGMDYAFSAEALKAPIGKVTDPVKGQKGYYLIKVLSRTPFDSTAFAVQKNNIKISLLRQKKNSFFSEWLQEIKKKADIVDHRSQFFTD